MRPSGQTRPARKTFTTEITEVTEKDLKNSDGGFPVYSVLSAVIALLSHAH